MCPPCLANSNLWILSCIRLISIFTIVRAVLEGNQLTLADVHGGCPLLMRKFKWVCLKIDPKIGFSSVSLWNGKPLRLWPMSRQTQVLMGVGDETEVAEAAMRWRAVRRLWWMGGPLKAMAEVSTKFMVYELTTGGASLCTTWGQLHPMVSSLGRKVPTNRICLKMRDPPAFMAIFNRAMLIINDGIGVFLLPSFSDKTIYCW